MQAYLQYRMLGDGTEQGFQSFLDRTHLQITQISELQGQVVAARKQLVGVMVVRKKMNVQSWFATRDANKPIGLVNFGNICYFSSLLQLMFHNPAIVELVLKYKPYNNNEKHDNFLKSLQKVFTELLVGNKTSADPSEVFQFMCWDSEDFYMVGYQQDFRELCELFFQRLDKSLNKQNQNSRILQRSQINLSQIHQYTCFKERTLSEQYELKKVGQYQNFYFINADLKFKNVHNLLFNEYRGGDKLYTLPQNFLIAISRYQYDRKFQQVVKLDNDFALRKEIYADFLIEEIPQVQQIFHRFQHSQSLIIQQPNESIQKIQDQIEAFEKVIQFYDSQRIKPTETIQSLKQSCQSLRDEIQKKQQVVKGNLDWLEGELATCCQIKYYLHAIVIHLGTAQLGHYYIYIYNFYKGKWYRFNDAIVDEVPEAKVLLHSLNHAYIVSYVSEKQKKRIMEYEETMDLIAQQTCCNPGVNLQEHFALLNLIPKNIYEEVLKQNEMTENR